MSNAKKIATIPDPGPRFGVVEGKRKLTMAARPVPSSETDGLTVVAHPPRSHRGLFLVSRDSPTDSVAPHATVDSFAHAQRIVAQVEQEIQKQAAREHQLRLHAWTRPLALGSEPFPARRATTGWPPAMDRLARFFGF